MSTFSVQIKRIRAIEPHPNADAIELAVVDGYRSVVRKGALSAGDLVAYIPEQAVLPEGVLRELGMWDDGKNCGKLSGKEGNRVKAIKLRGELSQGLIYAMSDVAEGDDVTERLGITKYEPPIPVHLAGEVFNIGAENTIAFDVENWKSWPDVIQEGEDVIITEKLHGTFTGVMVLPVGETHPEAFGKHKNILIFSKGLGAKGLVFKNNERNKDNIYVRATRGLVANIDTLIESCYADGLSFRSQRAAFFLGETYGKGVQDLHYGEALGFRMFAAGEGNRRDSIKYDDWHTLSEIVCPDVGVETVPVLYKGPFSVELARELAKGKTTLGADHIREGIVITPAIERQHPKLGRVCLKMVSDQYLTRKNGTEFI